MSSRGRRRRLAGAAAAAEEDGGERHEALAWFRNGLRPPARGRPVTPRLRRKPKPAAPAAAAQRTFDTPKAAADALIAAAATYDVPALKAILGPDGKALVATNDPVQDKNQLEAFAAQAREKTAVVPDAKNPNLAILSVGEEDWPLPIPIVRKSGKWSFDSKAGKREDPLPPHREKRARRDRGLPRLRRGAARVRAREARRLEREPVRAEDHQHPGKAGRPRVAQSPTGPREGPLGDESPTRSPRATRRSPIRSTATTSRS